MLPKEDQIRCMDGMIDAIEAARYYRNSPSNYDEWIIRTMGTGLAEIFMRPYSFKVWATAPTKVRLK
jgi:protoporphyrinogen oxidase